MKKQFIKEEQLLQESFRLAAKVFDSGFRPDFIVGIWRGGSSVGSGVHEARWTFRTAGRPPGRVHLPGRGGGGRGGRERRRRNAYAGGDAKAGARPDGLCRRQGGRAPLPAAIAELRSLIKEAVVLASGMLSWRESLL